MIGQRPGDDLAIHALGGTEFAIDDDAQSFGIDRSGYLSILRPPMNRTGFLSPATPAS